MDFNCPGANTGMVPPNIVESSVGPWPRATCMTRIEAWLVRHARPLIMKLTLPWLLPGYIMIIAYGLMRSCLFIDLGMNDSCNYKCV